LMYLFSASTTGLPHASNMMPPGSSSQGVDRVGNSTFLPLKSLSPLVDDLDVATVDGLDVVDGLD